MSISTYTDQPLKQRQRPSDAGPAKSSRSGDGTHTRRRADSSTVTRTMRTQNGQSQVTRKNANQMTAKTRSTSTDGSTVEMFTAKSRYTHTSRGVQAQTRGTRENTLDILSPPLTRSNSDTKISNMPTRSRSRVHTNPMSRATSNSKMKAISSQKSKAFSSLENLV